jgi:outer membrane immunogenic protein
MKKVLFASLVMAGSLSAPAFAADMSAPGYKAAPMVQQSTWAGPYIGAHLGYDWGRTRVLDNGVLTESGARTNGVVGGGLIGYNFQSGPLVYGLEFDIGGADLSGNGVVFIPPAIPNHYAVDWNGNLRARIGYLLWPQTLFFASGGFAFADFKFTHGPSGNSFSTVLPGWTVGGGIDHMFTPNFIVRLEYLYADYGNKTYQVLPADFYNAAFKTQTLRGALIWKF